MDKDICVCELLSTRVCVCYNTFTVTVDNLQFSLNIYVVQMDC